VPLGAILARFWRGLARFPLGGVEVTTFTESVVEEAALAWLVEVGWQVVRGAEIAPDSPAAERADYGEVRWLGGCARRSCGSTRSFRPRRWRMRSAGSRGRRGRIWWRGTAPCTGCSSTA
jgi:hypothetical protein